MADDRHRQDRSQQQNQPDDRSVPASRFPLAPAPALSAAEDHHHLHARGPGDDPRSAMAATVTLPSIHATGYGPQHAPPSTSPIAPRRYSHDPRYASPATVNGYPPPSPGQQPHAPYLLPLQTNPSDPRSPAYPPPDQRQGAYYDDRRPPPSPYPDPHHPHHHHHQSPQYPPEGYYYRGPPAPPPVPPPVPPPPNGYSRAPPGAYPEYAQPPGGASALAQAAPRQRTSIACRYCRKRKIRCSGYQNTPGGKCQNCARMNQECIFQPVSSSSSTAFIPVSAVPGGVPPGTQLFGAYGQPLAPNSVPVAPHPYPPAHHPAAAAAAPAAPLPMYYPQAQPRAPAPAQTQPGQSPTESFSSYGGEDATQVAGRRRRRTPEDRDEAYRLPPPRGAGPGEDDGRRRSPAELSNQSSPGGYVHVSHSDARRSPRSAASATSAAGQSSSGGQGTRSPGAQNGSSGTSTPGRQPSQQQQQQGGGGAGAAGQATASASVMSLSNVVEKNDIDRGMIDRLNRPRDNAQLSPSTPPKSSERGS